MTDAPVIVITGASRGIGLEICRQLAARDARVVLTARNARDGGKAAEKLSVLFHPLDVTDDASAAALRDFLANEFGHCDVLINNAGIIADGDDSILTVSPAAVQDTLATNTVAPLRITQALLPLLRQSKRGARVINVSSGAGELRDFDPSWSPAYSLSKAALNLVTRMLASALLSDGIAVNAMARRAMSRKARTPPSGSRWMRPRNSRGNFFAIENPSRGNVRAWARWRRATPD
jgi:NAD(P)-dependent dehydrogenase (short-subunit alcohol dehydrogenase family)